MDNIASLSVGHTAYLLKRLEGIADMAYMPSVRVQTGRDNFGRTWFKFDIGNTGWTEPLYNTDAQYDRPVQHVEIIGG